MQVLLSWRMCWTYTPGYTESPLEESGLPITTCFIVCNIPLPRFTSQGSNRDGILRKFRNHVYVPLLASGCNCHPGL